MPKDLYFHRFARQIKRKGWPRSEFLGTVPGAFGKHSNKARGFVSAQELLVEFGGEKNPAAAVERISKVIDLHSGSRHLATVFHAPGEWIEPRINRAGRAAAIVEVHRTQADDGAKRALPREARQGNRNVG